jgi:hypothetical protein
MFEDYSTCLSGNEEFSFFSIIKSFFWSFSFFFKTRVNFTNTNCTQVEQRWQFVLRQLGFDALLFFTDYSPPKFALFAGWLLDRR